MTASAGARVFDLELARDARRVGFPPAELRAIAERGELASAEERAEVLAEVRDWMSNRWVDPAVDRGELAGDVGKPLRPVLLDRPPEQLELFEVDR